jgi:hypothetical protein
MTMQSAPYRRVTWIPDPICTGGCEAHRSLMATPLGLEAATWGGSVSRSSIPAGQ